MSNTRKGGVAGAHYRRGYLRSTAWFGRRDRYFREVPDSDRCVVCLRRETNPRRSLELHHVSYEGVRFENGKWVAAEADEDLMPMHPLCHEQVHLAIERDIALASLITRRESTRRAIRVVRRRLIALIQAEAGGSW